MITSINNSQIKNIIQLQKKGKARREQQLFVVEGIKMVKEATSNHLVKIYVSESYMEQASKQLDLDLYPYDTVTDQIFKQVSDTITPQGILATVRIPEYTLEEILLHENENLLILEDIRDPGNLGTIFRTAEGAGITGIILSADSVDLFNPKVIRSTMGSVYRVPFVYVDKLKDVLLKVKEKGIRLYAAHLNGKRFYDEELYLGHQGILIGNEANGLTTEISELADCLVKIPMSGQVESLNAAMAAGILMYEVARQQRLK